MAACHNAESTGYETLASMNMSATRKNTATHFDISSDDGMHGQHSAVDKNVAPCGAASSTNERSDGTGSRPLTGSVTGASRARSRSSRATSKS